MNKTRHELIHGEKQQKINNFLPLVLHNDQDRNIQQKILEKWNNTIFQDQNLYEIFHTPKTIYKNNATIGTYLTSSDMKIWQS